MKKISEELMNCVRYGTKTRVYRINEITTKFEQYQEVRSIKKKYINTTAVLENESPMNPDGWKLEWSGKTSDAELNAIRIASQYMISTGRTSFDEDDAIKMLIGTNEITFNSYGGRDYAYYLNSDNAEDAFVVDMATGKIAEIHSWNGNGDPIISEDDIRSMEQEEQFTALLEAKQVKSQNELAKMTGINQKTINNLCTGRSDYSSATHSTLCYIADALGMSIDQLDGVILDGDKPEKRFIVETNVLDKDGNIKYSTEREGFDTREDAEQYYNTVKNHSNKEYKIIVYELDKSILN